MGAVMYLKICIFNPLYRQDMARAVAAVSEKQGAGAMRDTHALHLKDAGFNSSMPEGERLRPVRRSRSALLEQVSNKKVEVSNKTIRSLTKK